MTQKKGYSHFPLFVSCERRVFLVVGGGKIALRRVRTLLEFDFEIHVVAPEAEPALAALSESGDIIWRRGAFGESDLSGVSFATACTDDRETNRAVGRMCRARGIPVSVADAPEECDYFFPAIAGAGDIVAGVAGNGRDHRGVAEAAESLRCAMKEWHGGKNDGE